jgi:hypothetical protein
MFIVQNQVTLTHLRQKPLELSYRKTNPGNQDRPTEVCKYLLPMTAAPNMVGSKHFNFYLSILIHAFFLNMNCHGLEILRNFNISCLSGLLYVLYGSTWRTWRSALHTFQGQISWTLIAVVPCPCTIWINSIIRSHSNFTTKIADFHWKFHCLLHSHEHSAVIINGPWPLRFKSSFPVDC